MGEITQKEKSLPYGAGYWNKMAQSIHENGISISKILDEYHCFEVKKLIDRWSKDGTNKIVLKTDFSKTHIGNPVGNFIMK